MTSVLRGEPDDARLTDRLKAADMLGKRYRLFDEGSGEGASAVTLIDDIAAGEEAAQETKEGKRRKPACPPKGGGSG